MGTTHLLVTAIDAKRLCVIQTVDKLETMAIVSVMLDTTVPYHTILMVARVGVTSVPLERTRMLTVTSATKYLATERDILVQMVLALVLLDTTVL
jgi:hypothetical protein